MKFTLHKEFRYDEEDRSPKNYFKAVVQYYAYLNTVDFSGGKDLLKYFGDSFFHEGGVSKFILDLKAKQISMLIYRDSDREDFNDIRNKVKLPVLSAEQYQKDPVLYQCDFYGVKNLDVSILFSRLWAENEIMDTEITFVKKEKKYQVTIGFWKTDEISFKCNYCKVKIINPNRIEELTNRAKKKLPYCDYCKSHLLTPAKIKKALKETKKRIRQKSGAGGKQR